MTAAQKRRLREQRRRRRDWVREERRRRLLDFEEEGNVAVVRNEADTGTTSGLLNINVQVPIQIGANAQNINDSDNVSTTVI
jgi:hypothetical protein